MKNILVVDDNVVSLKATKEALENEYKVIIVTSAMQALKFLEYNIPDIILLDLAMPEMDGIEALKIIQKNEKLEGIPVIFLTASSDRVTEAECIELGAIDFISKPIVIPVLKSRIARIIQLKEVEASLSKERDISRGLLLNILPKSIADKLSTSEDKIIADYYESVSVLFSDIVGFTKLSSQIPTSEMVVLLNNLFSRFDLLALEYNIEKIKTMGDGYMAASGLPEINEDNAYNIVKYAVAMFGALNEFNKTSILKFQIRVGIDSGSVSAGIIGKTKFSYDIWGKTVNTAKRLEEYGISNAIHISQNVYEKTKDIFNYKALPPIEIKSIGKINTWILEV